MKIFLIVIIFLFSNIHIIGQQSSFVQKKIFEVLELNETSPSFYIDTAIKVESFQFYSVTPFPGGFSFLFPFFGDSLLNIHDLSVGYNRIPFEFEVFETESKGTFVFSKAYIETLSYSKIEFFALRINGNTITHVFKDLIFYKDKGSKRKQKTIFNSFEILKCQGHLIIKKKIGSSKDYFGFLERYGLKKQMPEVRRRIRITRTQEIGLG